MKRLTMLTALVLLAALLADPAAAGEAPPGGARFTGKVVVSKRELGVPAAATFAVPGGKTYTLVMDEAGKSLGSVMHGQTAEIHGVAEGDSLKALGYVDERVNAGHEFWRRMRCLACVVLPATVNAATPPDLKGAEALSGRPYDFKRRFTAWTRDERFLWVAADNELLQFDLDGRKLVRSYGKAEGLPDGLVYQLASNGKELWIAHRGGLAALAVGADSVIRTKVEAGFARACVDAQGAWVLADTGTVRIEGTGQNAALSTTHPELPTGERIRKLVDDGLWPPHWNRRTAHFARDPAEVGGRLYVGSYGDIHELDLKAGKWTKLAENAWGQVARGGKLYFLTAKGLSEHDPATGKTETFEPPEDVRGRYAQLVVTDAAAWLACEPRPAAAPDAPPTGGGLARFDLAARKWETWSEIAGRPAKPVACISVAADGAIWAVTMEGKYISKSAHPGMTTTRRQEFQPTGFRLLRHDGKTGQWESLPLALAELEKRLICGQDGCHGSDVIVPQLVDQLSVGTKRVFAMTRLGPQKFFGGYWPCVDQVASRPEAGAAWTAAFVHHPEQLALQGEQPLVLNISTGQLTPARSSLRHEQWEAIGQDLVLGLFCDPAGKHWAVTESTVGCFDEAAGSWQKLAGPEFRWYWRATALLDLGRYVYIGSDRGLVTRLDTTTGRFEPQVVLKERTVTRIEKGRDGEILVVTKAPPLGLLPVQLADGGVGRGFGPVPTLDAEAARFDGQVWTAVKADAGPVASPWVFKQLRERAKGYQDKTQGNYLCGPAPGDAETKPRYYLKEAFFPQFLSANPEAGRMWASTYTGLVRVDLPGPAGR